MPTFDHLPNIKSQNIAIGIINQKFFLREPYIVIKEHFGHLIVFIGSFTLHLKHSYSMLFCLSSFSNLDCLIAK